MQHRLAVVRLALVRLRGQVVRGTRISGELAKCEELRFSGHRFAVPLAGQIVRVRRGLIRRETSLFNGLGFWGDMESTLQLKRRPTLPAANRDWLFAESLRYGSATENESLAEKQRGPIQ